MNIIKHLDIEDTANVYVVGDIHGEYDLFIKQLFSMGFNPNIDIVISVGDIVDRGPQSFKCISLLNEHWFYCVTGNHEDFCIKGFSDSSIAYQHCFPNNGGKWFYKLDLQEQELLVNKFKSLPILLELKYKNKKYGFVHADVPVPDWDLLKDMVTNNIKLNCSDIKDLCLWSRRVVKKNTYHVQNIYNVFLGHTVVEDIKQVGNCTFLDTGAVFRNVNNNYKLSIIKL